MTIHTKLHNLKMFIFRVFCLLEFWIRDCRPVQLKTKRKTGNSLKREGKEWKLEIENELVIAITTQRSSEFPTAKAKGKQRNMVIYVVLIYGKRNFFSGETNLSLVLNSMKNLLHECLWKGESITAGFQTIKKKKTFFRHPFLIWTVNKNHEYKVFLKWSQCGSSILFSSDLHSGIKLRNLMKRNIPWL